MVMTAYGAAVQIATLEFASWLLLFLLALVAILVAFSKRRTKEYREALSDMYVAAKVREIATNEKIDLNEEYNTFKKWSKARRLEERNLEFDGVLEEELKEKLSQEIKPKK